MSKDIIVKGDDSQLALTHSKKLLSITSKVLSNDLVQTESWTQNLWQWTDDNQIDDYIFIKSDHYAETFSDHFNGLNLPEGGFHKRL